MIKIERAIISVSDKSGIVDFAKALEKHGVELLSTGGTFTLLEKNGIQVKQVSDYTGFPEMMDGRVKTLHPKIHGGILALRDNNGHLSAMSEHGILPIDMVVVNLYPFEETVSRPDATMSDAIENIDIGGPSMIRSAAKNNNFVTVVVEPADYSSIIAEMNKSGGSIKAETRLILARKAFAHTSAYDSAISAYLTKQSSKEVFPDILSLNYRKVKQLRYGENPHQRGGFYINFSGAQGTVAGAELLQGKEMSYNNYLDANAAFELALEFDEIVSVIVKHNNPCGVGIGENIKDAYLRALAVDPVSAYGGVLAFNSVIDVDAAKEISKLFVEVISAPDFTKEALGVFQTKQNLRLLKTGKIENPALFPITFRSIPGGLLVQDRDLGKIIKQGDACYSYNPVNGEKKELKIVTKRKPTEEEFNGLLLAWKVVKHTKSNAIIYSSDISTIGVGAGQMSRVDSAKIAVSKSVLPLKGAVMASDAFFPFRDGLDAAAEAGITAVIQPGGSIRDNDVIEAANEHGIAMVFTGMRHFRH